MKVSIIIPVYNERETILELLAKVEKIGIDKEIIVVDDGSTDGTSELIKEKLDGNVKVVHHDRNIGKGAAIRTGLKYTKDDIILIQDADLELDPNDYPRLIEPIVSGKTKVVYGSRFLSPSNHTSFLRYFANKILTQVTNLLYGAKITDEGTGYKVFTADLIKNLDLKCIGFEFCPEVTAKILRKRHSIYEVPISYRPRNGRSSKIDWKDGFKCLYTLFKYRLIKT